MKTILSKTILLLPLLLLLAPVTANAQGGYVNTYAVGDQAQGGTVIYVNPMGTYVLVGANQDQCNNCDWHEAYQAVNDSANYDVAGQQYIDWRIPTKEELGILYIQESLSGVYGNYRYWSSTFESESLAWIRTIPLQDDGSGTSSMTNNYSVRAVRSFNIPKDGNIFTGYQAGLTNTTGISNAFYGIGAGVFNTGGNSNTFTGYQAGNANTTASNNTFTGYQAGLTNTTGTSNAFYGIGAGVFNTGGNSNTFTGYQAGNANTTASNNTFTGYQAGFANTTGDSNTFYGTEAGNSNTTASNNTFTGYRAGYANTTGAKNTYIGYGAGENNSGSDNVCLGYKAGQNNQSGTRNVFLGFAAGINETGSNKLYIANSNTATPLIYGDFGTSALTVNGSLTVTGDAFKAGGGSWSVASDRRLKKDIEAFTDGLEVLEKINPVRFRYNGKAGMPAAKEYVGVIAQEMQKIAPYTVGTFTYKDTDGIETDYLEYDSSALNYIIINAIKAQQELIESQRQKIEALEDRLADTPAKENLEERIKTLESLLAEMTKKTPGTELHAAAVTGEK